MKFVYHFVWFAIGVILFSILLQVNSRGLRITWDNTVHVLKVE